MEELKERGGGRGETSEDLTYLPLKGFPAERGHHYGRGGAEQQSRKGGGGAADARTKGLGLLEV